MFSCFLTLILYIHICDTVTFKMLSIYRINRWGFFITVSKHSRVVTDPDRLMWFDQPVFIGLKILFLEKFAPDPPQDYIKNRMTKFFYVFNFFLITYVKGDLSSVMKNNYTV